MVIAKNIITFFLALLLANPACCCGLGGCGSAEKTSGPPVRSCCSEATSDEKNQDEPDKKHKCQCELNKQYTEHGPLILASPDLTLPTDPPVVFIDVDHTAPAWIVIRPHSERPPPRPAARILFSVFRL